METLCFVVVMGTGYPRTNINKGMYVSRVITNYTNKYLHYVTFYKKRDLQRDPLEYEKKVKEDFPSTR